jgi:S1-C subfamily serine protease
MADSIAGFLEKHPDYQMVVLAGIGHLQYGAGIPKRAAGRTGGDYAIILNDVDPEPGIADFVLYPGTFPEEVSPRLMVLLTDNAGRVEITGFPRNSVSQKGGVRRGDILLAINGSPVHTVDDVKIDLLYRKGGDKVEVTVSRKAFFGGGEKHFEIILQ